MPTQDSPPIAMRLSTAAANTGLSTRTLRRYIDSGDLPAVKLKHAILILQTDLEAFLTSRRVDGGA